ncbi:MAG: hypothetical protein JRN06_01520 [Nitrososphaerota archaeon]|nr:hypothetical protein [Nitrososphaerota archaeon]MDG7023468.1 hypothetical protein [Nitrososphaerota archaeon]
MKVGALFTDYDGTIAPATVSREESAVPTPLRSVLEEISSRIPVAVVTSKDLRFVKPRTTFAWAWAAVLGLELRKRDGSGSLARVSARLQEATERVRKTLPPQVIVEEKRGSDESLLGVSFDWTAWVNPSLGALEAAEKAFREEGFQVDRYLGATYVDVYAAPADKGRALRELAEALPAKRPIMYLGDTEADNWAFEAADISVGVLHQQKTGNLRCRYSVRYDDLRDVLAQLLAGGLEFDDSPSGGWGRGS